MREKKWRNKNFIIALKHSLDGIKNAFTDEKNLKIQILIALIVIALGFAFKLTIIEFAVLFITIGLVLSAELLNTAIEIMLDLYSEEYNEKIKRVKDISSGAVLVTAIVSIMVGITLFLPKII